MLYLDAAATTPVRREVLEAMWPYLTGQFGNPSSHHTVGEAAAAGLDAARKDVAKVLGCRPGEVVFTSGGTEADNQAIKGIALASDGPKHIVTTAIEHPAVDESCDYLARHHGFRITRVPVDGGGLVDTGKFADALGEGAALCTVMYANNEVGTVQPIAELAALAKEHGVPFHTDAVQAAGWETVNVKALGVDALSLAGHKLGAPKGCGALYLRGRLRTEPLVHGGGQQRGRRSGTENVAGAVAMASALTLAEQQRPQVAQPVAELRDRFIARVLDGVDGAILTGHPTRRLSSIASFCFPGTSGESVLLELERLGYVSSSGSACAAGSDEPSPVLTALGIDAEVAQTAVRFSFTASITDAELDAAAEAAVASVATMHRLG
ncbi:cysteine desulfurase family protein [Arthrobacter castelli]|uniref:cysteine desulfurase family protein n=1 Tax=Arthrobacter castelli TaxID=271431 RepID=UPI0003FECD12|nr:cysteine desulfurase family protein [Arthrobacter castelli]